MRTPLAGLVLMAAGGPLAAADPPLAEKYLHSGELARGEQALEAALAAAPKDDRLRFGLGVVRFVRAVERLGQGLHEYGARSDDAGVPFLRLPVPRNPDPAPVSYDAFRRVLDGFRRDLLEAEATLAGVTDDRVALPLRLAAVRLDLDGDGKPTDRFTALLERLMGRRPDFLRDNPEFLVRFDRADVAWLRAYCHLLAAMADFYLAFDTRGLFDAEAGALFARPKVRPDDAERARLRAAAGVATAVAEPARLGRFRRHLLAVCALNRETWAFARAETDDDHEWLPNARQTGVIGLPVRDEMIDAWLGMIGELEALLEGKRLVPGVLNSLLGWQTGGRLLNLRTLLDDPPAVFDWDEIQKRGPAAKYLDRGPEVNLEALIRVGRAFTNPLSVAYAAWFN